MNLDDLKRRWDDLDRRLQSSLRLNERLLADVAVGRVRARLRPLAAGLWIEIALAALAILWTGGFAWAHAGEPRFVIPALALLAGGVALAVAAARALVAWRRLDYGASVAALQQRLESLRIERIVATQWTFLLAPLAWTPLSIVAARAWLGLDVLAAFGAPYVAANLGFGLVVLAVGAALVRRLDLHGGGPAWMRALVRDLAGRSLVEARAFVDSLVEPDATDR